MKNQPVAPQHPGLKNLEDLKHLEGLLKAKPKYQLRFVELFLNFLAQRPDLVTSDGRAMLVPILENTLRALKAKS